MKQEDFVYYAKSTLIKQLMNLPEDIEHKLDQITIKLESNKICIFAIGESIISAEIIAAYINLHSKLPITIINDGRIPGWINYDNTAILISNSGYNDIINEIYNELIIRNCSIICISSGGVLKEQCLATSGTYISLSEKLTPRTSIGEELAILASLIENTNICDTKQSLSKSLSFVKEFRNLLINHKIDINRYVNDISGNTIAIYGIAELRATCKRWKAALNVDAKCLAFCSDLPEFDHNELVGWANHKQPTKNIKMIILRCKTEYVLEQIIDSMISVLKDNGRDILVVDIPGSNSFEKNLCGILIGDYISQMLSSRINKARLLTK